MAFGEFQPGNTQCLSKPGCLRLIVLDQLSRQELNDEVRRVVVNCDNFGRYDCRTSNGWDIVGKEYPNTGVLPDLLQMKFLKHVKLRLRVTVSGVGKRLVRLFTEVKGSASSAEPPA